jgi:hypothetical protein
MAEIISLADARAARSRLEDAAAVDPEKLRTFQLMAQIKRNLGLAPDYRGDWVVTRRPPDEETEDEAILRLIKQIADNLGIDVEAPFRRLARRRPQDPPASKNPK